MTATPNGGQLKSIADRIDRIDDEIKDLNGDKKDVYAEAKAFGYDTKVLKAAIQRRRNLADNAAAVMEADALLEMYLGAITEPADGKRAPRATPATAQGNLSKPSRARARSTESGDEPFVVGTTASDGNVADEMPSPLHESREDAGTAMSSVASGSTPETAAFIHEPAEAISPAEVAGEPAPAVLVPQTVADEEPELPSYLDRRHPPAEAEAA